LVEFVNQCYSPNQPNTLFTKYPHPCYRKGKLNTRFYLYYMSFNREILNRKFREEYEKLNEAQRQAVDKIEGPVMVIAGPGTGKTQILAARIGRILLDTDVQPENLLCLTFTDAGSLAMRKRLIAFIGSDAYKVNIYTFHAFCNDIIQENLNLFEKNSLDPISELEKIDLLTKLIDRFPKNHPLKRYRGDVYYEISNLQGLFSIMKKEGWTPAFINQKIDDYIKDLPLREEFVARQSRSGYKKGDIRTDWVEAETEKMLRLKAGVNEFDSYQELMKEKDRYDFDDMINWVIKAFSENKQLLATYQERYQYILVDEYQDTSGSQNMLISLLINFWEVPNIFVVGDDDQSIYRFQGANVQNMQDFVSSYSQDLLKVVLTNNYRSTQQILDVSKSLIDKNNERLISQFDGLTKELISTHPDRKDLMHWPEIREYENHHQEMADITLSVEQLIRKGVSPGKIAVIYKENRYGDELYRLFQSKKIPVYTRRNVNLFTIPLAKKIIQLLRYLSAEHDIPYGGDEMLFEILHFDFFNVPPIEIAKVSVEVAEKHFTAAKTSMRRLLYEKVKNPPRDLFDPGIHPALKVASLRLENLIAEVPNVTLQHLFESLIRTANILGTVMQSEEKIWLMQVVIGFFDFIKEETRRQPDLTLARLVEMIDLMEHNHISIPLIRTSGTDKGVNLVTAHGSKGLEFEYVFFAACNAIYWEKKKKPSSGYKYPDTLFANKVKANDEEELRRLFYVALTRAEKHLYISYAKSKGDGKVCEPTKFIAEILDGHQIPVDKMYMKEGEMADFNAMLFQETAAPEIEKIEENFITEILDRFVMNVTALNNYLKCPLEFYFKTLIKIPSPKNEATEFGSSVHFAIQRLFEKMKTDPMEMFPAKVELLQDFKWYMHRHRESFTKQAYERRLEYGIEVLDNYYDRYKGSWNKIVAIERNIRNVFLDNVPLKGKLDKLEFNSKEVNVVDYKTGDPDNAKDKLKSPDDKNPSGGDYWRQAVFYKILVDNHGSRDWKVVSTEFDFIEPDKKKIYRKEKIFITPDDIEFVSRQITETWQKIQDHQFYTGCGKKECHWCNFVKTNNLQVALHEVEEGEEV